MLPRNHTMSKSDRAILGMTPKDIERFWSKVQRSDDPTACWLWTGATARGGYGVFTIGNRVVRAHRIAWFVETGEVPFGLFVCHHCDTPPCCKFADLFVGTPADNMADKCSKSRQATGANVSPKRPARGDRNGARLYPERMTHGERHHSARFAPADIIEIRALHSAGEDCAAIARKRGVCTSSIWKIVTRRSWAHVA